MSEDLEKGGIAGVLNNLRAVLEAMNVPPETAASALVAAAIVIHATKGRTP